MLINTILETLLIVEATGDDEQTKLTKAKIKELSKEWSYLEKQAAVMALLTKKITSRIEEIQEVLLPVVKEEESKAISVNHALIEYASRKSTGVKYQKAFEKALELVNAEQKAFLEDFKETVTTRSVIESVKLVDPKLGEFLAQLKTLDVESLISLLPKVKKLNEWSSRSVAEIQQDIDRLIEKALRSDKEEMPAISAELGKLQKEKIVALDAEYKGKMMTEGKIKDAVIGAVDKLVSYFKRAVKSLTSKQKRVNIAVDRLEAAASSKDR